MSDREQGQSKLNAVLVSGELVCNVTAKEKVEAIQAKMNTAKEDWKNLMTNLHNRETGLQVRALNASPKLGFKKDLLLFLKAKSQQSSHITLCLSESGVSDGKF